MKQETKEIMTHEEATEVINLGTTMKENDHKMLIELLREYVDIFVWSYQDMLRLDPNIVEHKLLVKHQENYPKDVNDIQGLAWNATISVTWLLYFCFYLN